MTPMTVGQLYDRAVLHGGDRVAISFGDRQITYRELGETAARLVGGLRAQGVKQGDRVAFLMANCAEYVACEYAVALLGATRIPLAVQLGNDDHVYMMNFARCKALVYHEKLAARVAQMSTSLTSIERMICVSDDPGRVPSGHVHLQSLAADNAPAVGATEIDPEDIAGIYFTGGTTGRPKGVMLSHRSWFHTYYVESLAFEIAPRDTFVFCTPLTHAAGCLLLPVLLRQGRCVVLDHFDPGLLLSTIAKERATATLLVPTMIYTLLEYADAAQHDVSSLRNVLYGAAAIAPERLKQAIERYGSIFTQFYGQTEAPMALTALSRVDHVGADPRGETARLTSAGRATFPTQIRLVDDDGQDVAPGEPGELISRSPNMMSGYLDDPQTTASTVRDGWLYTGDVARMDDSGYYTIVDRKKDMIVSGGFNVYPREVEDVLFNHPGVRQAAVLGVPHERWGEEVKALVVRQTGAAVTEAELIAFVKQSKGSVVAPKSVEFVDAIPTTNLGKVDKKAIRARYWGGRTRNV